MLLGCAQTTPEFTPSVPTSTLKPLPTNTELPPSESPTEAPVCPAINPEVEFFPPEDDGETGDTILSYINDGGDPHEINFFFDQYRLKTLDLISADLNDDGLNEIIVAGTLPPEFNSTNEGAIYIFGCKNKSYELKVKFNIDRISNANIIRTEKLLNEQPHQVIIHYQLLAGWGAYYIAVGLLNGEWRVIFRDSEFFPKIVVFDEEGDGNKEIAIHSITTATQGPQREMISTFKWDGKSYTLVSNQLMPGTTRVEYLDDAQSSLDQGDISMAIAYYDRAAHDEALHDFLSREEWSSNRTELSRNYQISFALFRLAILWFSTGDEETGKSVLYDLTEQFPKNVPGYEFAEAAKIFHEQTARGASPPQACSRVTVFFTEKFPDLNIHIGNWGTSVTDYNQLVELCPFL